MPQPLVPATAFGDAWIQVDRTENPRFFVNLLDATRARLLERARTSPGEFFAPLALRPGLNILDVGCGTGDFVRLLAPIVSPGTAVGVIRTKSVPTLELASKCYSSSSENFFRDDGNKGRTMQAKRMPNTTGRKDESIDPEPRETVLTPDQARVQLTDRALPGDAAAQQSLGTASQWSGRGSNEQAQFLEKPKPHQKSSRIVLRSLDRGRANRYAQSGPRAN